MGEAHGAGRSTTSTVDHGPVRRSADSVVFSWDDPSG